MVRRRLTFEVEDLERDFSNSFSGRCNSGFNRDDRFYDQSYFAWNRGCRPYRTYWPPITNDNRLYGQSSWNEPFSPLSKIQKRWQQMEVAAAKQLGQEVEVRQPTEANIAKENNQFVSEEFLKNLKSP
jgi:hypothetical protein